jgi:formylglycine-generating enzyme required for sulfatase activity
MNERIVMGRRHLISFAGVISATFLAGGCAQLLGIEGVSPPPMDAGPPDAGSSGSDARPLDPPEDAATHDALVQCNDTDASCPDGQYCVNGSCESPPVGMVAVPQGELSMGCNTALDAACAPDESPYHVVNLSNFAIDWLEVSVGQYQACVDAGECSLPHDQNAYGDACNWSLGNNYPITCVDWFQARTYCQYVGKRLPTEAEWEKAARGTDGRIYPWGAATPTCELAVYQACPGSLVQPVGSKPEGASPYGTLDMAGNVFEWVNDWYSASYYSVSPIDDPAGPSTGTRRVTRSGAPNYDSTSLRPSFRGVDFEVPTPSDGNSNVGFRCALSP